MEKGNILIWVLLSLFIAFIALVIGFYAYNIDQKSELNRIFFYSTFPVVFYNLSLSFFRSAPDYQSALFWSKVGFVWPFILSLQFHFVLVLIGKSNFVNRFRNFFIIYGLAIYQSLLHLFTDYFPGKVVYNDWGWDFEKNTEVFTSINVILTFIYPFLCLILCIYSYSKIKDELRKKQVKWITIGFITFFIWGFFSSYLDTLNMQIPNFYSYSYIFLCICFFYTIRKHELFHITPVLVADSIINTMGNLLFLTNSNNKIIGSNPSTAKTLSFSSEKDLIEKPLDLFLDPTFVKSIYNLNESKNEKKDLETSLKNKYGKSIPVLLNISPVISKGNIKGFITIGINISNRKKIEELRLREITLLEKNKYQKTIIRTISHEFRTLITALYLSVNNLNKYRDKLSTEQIEHVYDTILAKSIELNIMMEQLITITNIDKQNLSIEWSDLYLNEVITEVVSEFKFICDSKNNVIEFLNSKEDLKLKGDVVKLMQVIRILINNALKFSPENGKVTIHITKDYKKQFKNLNNNGVMIRITDQGQGIKEDDLPYIFDRFYKTKESENISGLGLGLPIARELIHHHKGNIFVESEFGKGSVFSVFLPFL